MRNFIGTLVLVIIAERSTKEKYLAEKIKIRLKKQDNRL